LDRLAAASEGRIVVLSPHLDDAVLSLGASIAYLSRQGTDVDVVTVLAGEPSLHVPAGSFDRSCGFSTAGEAARVRQAEDAEACKIVGARPIWLPFWNGHYSHRPEAAGLPTILESISAVLEEAGLVMLPGFPLLHPEHAWLSELVLEKLHPDVPVCLYVEQPYAMYRFFGSSLRVESPIRGVTAGLRARRKPTIEIESPLSPSFGLDVDWRHLNPSRRDWLAKQRSIAAYRSQLPELGRLMKARLIVWEWCWGGEAVGFVQPEPAGLPSR
jgi:LmbE family N-acetylglucosaminyl deacetylase